MSNGEVNLFASQVDHACRSEELKIDTGISAFEGSELGYQPIGRKRWWQSKADDAAAVCWAKFFGCSLDLQESRFDLLKIAPTGVRQSRSASRAVDESYTEPILEAFNLMADG